MRERKIKRSVTVEVYDEVYGWRPVFTGTLKEAGQAQERLFDSGILKANVRLQQTTLKLVA